MNDNSRRTNAAPAARGQPRRVAVVGAGFAATMHLPAWADQRAAEVVTVVDRDQARAHSLARQWDVADVADDVDNVLARADIVDVCVPAAQHSDLGRRALEAGKHVFMEKPLASSLDEAAAVASLASRSDRVFMVAENWVFCSAARAVMRVIEDGVLGEVFLVRAHHESALCVADGGPAWVSSPAVAGGGYALNAATHSISLLRQLAGDVESLSAHGHWREAGSGIVADTDVVVAARLVTGPVVSMTLTGRSRHVGERRLGYTIWGDAGVAELDITSGWTSWTVDGMRTDARPSSPSMGFSEEVAHFVECVVAGREPVTSARDQVETLRTVAAIYDSLRRDGASVRLADVRAAAEQEPGRQR